MGLCIIGAADVESYQKKGGILVDIRPLQDYRRGHIAGAVSVPAEQLEEYMRGASKSRLFIFYCQHGSRSFQEGKKYVKAGYRICTLAGGFRAYAQREGSGGTSRGGSGRNREGSG